MGFAPSQWWERASLHFWECSWQTKYWTERGISEAPSRISSFHKQTVSFLQFSRCAGCGEQQPRWGMRHFLLGFCSSLSLFSLDNAADGTCINKQGCSFSCGKPAALFWLFNTTDRVLIHRNTFRCTFNRIKHQTFNTSPTFSWRGGKKIQRDWLREEKCWELSELTAEIASSCWQQYCWRRRRTIVDLWSSELTD